MINGNTVASIDVTLGSVYEVDTSTNITADAYYNTSTYSVGDYVIYAKSLYKCNTTITEPEDFDAEKWDKVKLANEVEALGTELDEKADADSVYTKSEVDTALADKADKSTTYTKSETDTLLDAKADANNTYTKTEVDTALQSKADANNVYSKSEVYTKSETDTALVNKADSSSVYTKDEVYNKTQVDNIINNLPEPMIFKGTLGINGTITELPVASSSNEGFTYKVITDGTYASIVAKVGDVFVSDGSTWVLIPAGDTDSDSWRNIKVNGVEKLGSAISSGAVDFADTTNIKASFDPSGNKVQFTLDGVYTSSEVDTALSAKANSADVYTKTETYSKTEVYNKTETYNKAEVDSKVGKPEFTKTFSPTPIATLTGGAENVPMKSLTVNIVPKETGTGTKSPSNPYTISGSTEIKVVQAGKNIFNPVTVLNAYLNSTGVIKSSVSTRLVYARINPNTTYTVSKQAGQRFQVAYCDSLPEAELQCSGMISNGTASSITITTGATAQYIVAFVYHSSYDTVTPEQMLATIQIEQGSTATTYEPYSATTHTIALGQTIYGGVCDVTGGHGNETYGFVDLGNLDWTEISSGVQTRYFQAKLDGVLYDNTQLSYFCECYSPAPIGASGSNVGFYITNTEYIRIRDTDFATVTDFKTGMSGMKFVYPLATPTALFTTPTAIKTTGYDNVSADCGDVEGEYYTEQVDDIVDLVDDAKELPEVTSADAGSVLAVNSNGEWDKKDAPREVPVVTSADEGKKLVVTSGGTVIANYDQYANNQICGYLNTWSASGKIYRTVVTDLSFSKSGNDAKTSTAITGVNVNRIVGIHCVIKDTVSGSSPVYYIPVGSKTMNGSNTTINISATTTLVGVYVTVEEDGDNASGYSADVIIEYTLAST